MTHDLSFYITLNLDHQTAKIETVDSTIIIIKGFGIIDFYIFVGNMHSQIELSNIYYLLKLDSNLILFGILEEKGYKFRIVNSLL